LCEWNKLVVVVHYTVGQNTGGVEHLYTKQQALSRAMAQITKLSANYNVF